MAIFDLPITWREISKRTFKEMVADDCLGLAAQLAYYLFLALFPAILFLLALGSFFPLQDLAGALVRVLRPVASRGRRPDRRRSDPAHLRVRERRPADVRRARRAVEQFGRDGGDHERAQRRLRHRRGAAVVEGAADRHRPDHRPRGVHPALVLAGPRRSRDRGVPRTDAADGVGGRVGVEDPAVAARLRARLDRRSASCTTSRRMPSRNGCGSRPGAMRRHDPLAHRLAGFPRLRHTVRRLQRDVWRHRRRAWCCCSGSTCRASPSSSAPR